MVLGKSLVVVCTLLALALGVLPAAAAPAERPAPREVPPGLTLSAPPTYAGQDAPVTATLADEAGEPVAGASLRVERRSGDTWAEVAVLTTAEDGTASLPVTLTRRPEDNVLRASWAGDETHEPQATGPVTLPLRRRNARLRVKGPDEVVDESSVRVAVRWTTGSGDPVAGEVALQRKRNGRWREVEVLTTDERGRAHTRIAPRDDSRWRFRTARQPWLERGRSPVHRVDNVPPGSVVRLGGPDPRRSLPRAPRAQGEGPAASITRVPGKVWRSMKGRTWHRGCPVGRPQLRLLRINYWGYDGYRYRGELVAAASVVGQMAGALRDMYDAGLPIRSMVRADRFGWSSRLKGADDYASMAAGNTSAFNCRQVVGRTGVRSPHSWGRALDINTWENPYRSSHGLVPNSWWASRSHPRVAWRSSQHRVVSIMRRHGLRWTYGTADSHHFDAVSRSAKRGGHEHDEHAPVLPPECATEVCD